MRDANAWLDRQAPWKKVKDGDEAPRLPKPVRRRLCLEAAYVLATLHAPFIPGTSARVFSYLRSPIPPRPRHALAGGTLQWGSILPAGQEVATDRLLLFPM